MKLHLGCGQRYLVGYVNIDYSLTNHTVQEGSIADLHKDILELNYPKSSIEEVRLHHVFEHFSRPIACALLAGWSSWLKAGGIIHIEVPDFKRTSRVILNPFTSLKKKAVAIRHLYGSHEASWAIHCEGYTPNTLSRMLEFFYFDIEEINKNTWKNTYNFEIIAKKNKSEYMPENYENSAKKYLSNYLLDDSEEKLLSVWMLEYQNQFDKMRVRCES